MRSAVITPYYPWPADTGGKLRSYYLLRGLAQYAEVDLYTVYYGDPPAAGPLGQLCHAVHMTPLQPPPVRWPQLRTLLNPQPRSVEYFRTAASMAAIRKQLSQPYDLLICDEISMAPYLAELPNHRATPRIVMRQKIDYLHYAEMAQSRPLGMPKLLDWLEARRLKRHEYAAMAAYDGAVVCSAEDAALAAQQGNHLPIEIIVNGADIDYFTPERRPDPEPTLLLLGTMHYYPNIDAVLYFFQQMYPALRQAIPQLKVLIVGHLPPPEIIALGQKPGVTVTGSVPDVRDYMRRSWAMAVPLRLGGGTRLKIVESMVSGLPVVTTRVGAQGLDAQHNQHLLLADSPSDFVQQTIRLLQDPTLQRQLADQALILARATYSWQSLGERFANFCYQIAAQQPKACHANQP
ncbi:MAG: glycosyltransferase family 4 protein [Caldilineaceae bacterium]